MALPYRQFATWTLSDLALRADTEDTDRITFAGNHMSAQHLLPVRSQEEPGEQFAARLRDFRNKLPRHSDQSERLALAFEAFVRLGEKQYCAAHEILKILRTAPAQKQADYNRSGIGYAYKAIDFCIGSTQRGYRTKRKKRGLTTDERQAQTIRVQACKFRRRHDNFAALFDQRLGSYRAQFCKDAEWYAAAEERSSAQAEEFEKRREPYDWYTAMPLANTAYLYHEQRKFPQALVYYRKAIRAGRRVLMHQNLRTFVLSWMRTGVKLCLREAGIVRMPPYAGPWLPERQSASQELSR